MAWFYARCIAALFSVADVKRYIDLISHYKMNVLHLHLTDDQGWRIEIKSWPNLAVHGGTTQVGGERVATIHRKITKRLLRMLQNVL